MTPLFVFFCTMLGFINQRFMWAYSALAYGLALCLFALSLCGLVDREGLANEFVEAQTGFSLGGL